MRVFCMVLLAAALVAAGSRTAPAAAVLKDGALHYEAGGKKTVFAADDAVVEPVRGSKLQFVTLDEDAAKRIGKNPSLLVFDASGVLAAETSDIPDVDIEQISDLSLSPAGNILAVSHGTWVVRDWSFLTFPGLAPAGKSISHLSGGEDRADIAWVDGDRVLVTVLNEKSGRTCGDYDPCGKRSVVMYGIRAGKVTPVLAGTDLCDYELGSFDGKVVTAHKACAKTVKDWDSADSMEKGVTRSTITVPLPGMR